MKLIIFSAFNGRLLSEPIEWPNEPFHIDIPLARSVHGSWNIGKDIPGLPPPMIKLGRFEHTGKYPVLTNGRTAAIYELVGI